MASDWGYTVIWSCYIWRFLCLCIGIPAALFLLPLVAEFLSFLFFKHLYWSIIALQWCVSFCFITKWISYTYISPYLLPLASPSHTPSPTPLGGHKAWRWSPCALRLLPTSYFTFGSPIYVHATLSLCPTFPFPSPCPQVHSLHLRLYSCSAPRLFRTIFFCFF